MQVGIVHLREGKPILIIRDTEDDGVEWLKAVSSLSDYSTQFIQCRWGIARDDIVKLIREMNTMFKLDTQKPLTFPCIKSSTPAPIWNRPDGGVHGTVVPEGVFDSGLAYSSRRPVAVGG